MATMFNQVSTNELQRFLAGITDVVRLSGSADEAKAFDYIENELRSFGFDVTRYESDALVGYPGTASLAVLGDNGDAIPCNGYALSPGTGPEGVSAELVDLGEGTAADFARAEVRGKIVLTDGLASPGKGVTAAAAGAVGHIHNNGEHIHEMCISPVWGTPIPETAHLLPSVPAVSVVAADAGRLRARLRQGPVQVRLTAEPFRGWVKLPTLIADLPGQTEDRFILFSGHVDSWHYGVMDNGTANAVQVEVGRLLAEHRGQLRRGLRLAFWSGHSHGRYAGSAWYADSFWQELHDRCAMHVNIDSVGAIGATVLSEAASMAETHAFGNEILTSTVGETLDYQRISRSSDQSFWGHGIPTLFAALSQQAAGESETAKAQSAMFGGGAKGGGLGWWWHTTEDTADKIDPDLFTRDAGIYAETLWRLCTDERLPVDPAAAADEIAAAATRLDAAAGAAFDLAGTAALATDLGAAIRAANLAALPADEANALVMSLSRMLIPVNYTRSGPFNHDLALPSEALPGLTVAKELANLNPGEDRYYFALTQLRRERNRIDAALHAAMNLVNGR